MQKSRQRIILSEILAAILLAVFILAVVRKPARDDVSFDELKEALLAASFDSTNMKEGSALKLRTLYGLSADDYEEVLLYVPSTNMDAQELLLIRCRTEEDTANVTEAMRQRVEQEKGVFSSYGIEQMALLNKAFYEARGCLCLYVCDKNSDMMHEAFLKATK